MIFVKPSYEIVPQVDDLLGAYERAEIGARTCYKSENAIKYDDKGRSKTATDFVSKLMNVNKHGSIAEHGAVYLTAKEKYICFPDENNWEIKIVYHEIKKYIDNPYSWVKYKDGYFYITTNLRVINENNWGGDLHSSMFEIGKTPNHEERLTIRFQTQIAITREANRHRAHSPSEQSTRYCNYTKDKFSNEIHINVPEFVKDSPTLAYYTEHKDMAFYNYCDEIAHLYYDNNFEKRCDSEFDIVDYWLFGNLACEFAYQGMIRKGAKPEQARTVLPLDTNSELVHTAYISDWIKFLKLRCAENAHPDIRVLALQIKEDFIKNGWWKE